MLRDVERSTDVASSSLEPPSKNQLKVAGERIRRRSTGVLQDDAEQAAADVRLVKAWRSAHSAALTATRNGLGLIVMRTLQAESQAGLVTQRLKRFESIVAKLVRTKPRLAEIEDIAGCRSVLPDLATVQEVQERLGAAKKLEIVAIRDYNDRPHAGGYRALHLWCRRDGFKVEVQLRTTRQQEWAERVEEWDKMVGLDIKHEQAPDIVLKFFSDLADYYYNLDVGVADLTEVETSLLASMAVVEEWATGKVV